MGNVAHCFWNPNMRQHQAGGAVLFGLEAPSFDLPCCPAAIGFCFSSRSRPTVTSARARIRAIMMKDLIEHQPSEKQRYALTDQLIQANAMVELTMFTK